MTFEERISRRVRDAVGAASPIVNRVAVSAWNTVSNWGVVGADVLTTRSLRQEFDMARYDIRELRRDDFETLMALEDEVFGADGEPVLGPYYVRLCCDFFPDTCFLATVDGNPAGYILGFLKGREVYCTTLAVVPEYQGTRVVHYLLRAFCRAIIDRADSIWFTVEEDNAAARAVHATLGAKNVEVRKDFYGPGQDRIVSRLDREVLVRLRKRYERLGFIERKRAVERCAQSGGQSAAPLEAAS